VTEVTDRAGPAADTAVTPHHIPRGAPHEEQRRRHRPHPAHRRRPRADRLAATGTVGAWGWIGIVPLATGALRFCPLYPLLGFSSCPVQNKG